MRSNSKNPKIKPISEHKRYLSGYIPWDERKNAKMDQGLSVFKHAFHKPYAEDWGEATKKAWNKLNDLRESE